jgi:hypothetical protein
MTAAQTLSQAGQGITALGADAAKRAAFAKSVGMSGLGMATAPMMAPDKAPGEVPTDDEMYVYDFDYGRTGADSMPTDSSAERMHLNPTFSNRRKIKAPDYFNAAEGGEVDGAADAGGMSGASKAAFDYLMGNASTSRDPARMDPQMMQGIGPAPKPVVGGDNMYAFDPATGTFLRNPNVPGASTSGSPVGTSFSGSGGDYQPVGPNPDFDTPEKQATFYADPKNAVFGDITRAGQKAFSYTPMSLFARTVAPEYAAQRAAEQDRITRGDYSSGFAIGSDGSPASGYGVDSWSGNMSDYAGSDIDQGDRGEAAGGLITLADGGLTGLATGGQINLQGTFDVGQGGGGQFGQANANGYQAAGGGPLQGFSSSFGQMGGSDPRAGGGLGNSASPLMGGLSGYGAAMRGLSNMGGLDRAAVQADPQGFAQHMAQMQQREMSMPGSTMMGGMGGMGGGMARQPDGLYEQLLAGRNPMQQDVQMTREQFDQKQQAQQQFNQTLGGRRVTPEPVAMFGSRSSSYATGGLMGLAKGGMKSGGFVVPADVVSMIGEGNTDAGYNRLKSMIPGATAIKGKDGGQADTVKTSIEGKQPARVAHGEMYIPPETVKRMGGAKKLYAMMDRVRQQATGSKKQIKPVSLKRAMA